MVTNPLSALLQVNEVAQDVAAAKGLLQGNRTFMNGRVAADLTEYELGFGRESALLAGNVTNFTSEATSRSNALGANYADMQARTASELKRVQNITLRVGSVANQILPALKDYSVRALWDETPINAIETDLQRAVQGEIGFAQGMELALPSPATQRPCFQAVERQCVRHFLYLNECFFTLDTVFQIVCQTLL